MATVYAQGAQARARRPPVWYSSSTSSRSSSGWRA